MTLVAPLKVFASIHGTPLLHDEALHRLLIANIKDEPYMLIQDLSDVAGSIPRLGYSECHYDTKGEFQYTEQLEHLIHDFTQGYNSVAVSISIGYAETRLTMVDTVLDRLKSILHQNIHGNAEYGFISFTDQYCYDYGKQQQIDNHEAAQMDIRDILQPLERNTANYTLDPIKFASPKLPTLFICRLTDSNSCQSDFAWVDIPSLSSVPDPQNCTNSYTEFGNLIKSYTDSQFTGRLKTDYSMTHLLSQYFGGSYQTKVFAHFAEYGKYDIAHDFNILKQTSELRNIKCVVSQNRPNLYLLEQSRNHALQHELKKAKDTVEKLKLTNENLRQENDRLNEQAASHEVQTSRLTLTKKVTRAVKERQKLAYEIQLADMQDEMNRLQILLVQEKVARSNVQNAMIDMEYVHATEKQKIDQLEKIQNKSEHHIKILEQQINAQHKQIKSMEHDHSLHNRQNEIWELAENVYQKQLQNMDTQMRQLTKKFNILSCERDKVSNNKFQRVTSTNVSELGTLRGKLQQFGLAQEGNRVTTLKQNNDRIHSMIAKQSHSQQKPPQQSQRHSLPTSLLQMSLLGGYSPSPPPNTTHDSSGIHQQESLAKQLLHEPVIRGISPTPSNQSCDRPEIPQQKHLSQSSFIQQNDDDGAMSPILDGAPITASAEPPSPLEQNQPPMITPLHTKEQTPPTPPTPRSPSPPKKKTATQKSSRQPLKPIHSPVVLSASTSPILSPILPTQELQSSPTQKQLLLSPVQEQSQPTLVKEQLRPPPVQNSQPLPARKRSKKRRKLRLAQEMDETLMNELLEGYPAKHFAD